MRVTIEHQKSRAEAQRIIDQSIEDALRMAPPGPVSVADVRRQWTGPHLDFSLTAKAGFLRSSIRGTVDVTDTDVTIEVELPGMLKRLAPEEKVRQTLETKVKGLLR